MRRRPLRLVSDNWGDDLLRVLLAATGLTLWSFLLDHESFVSAALYSYLAIAPTAWLVIQQYRLRRSGRGSNR